MAYLKLIIGLINAFCRVIVFVGYWWAFDSMSDFLGGDDQAFRNNIQSWQHKAISNLSIIAGSCPNSTETLTWFTWPGSYQFYEDNGTFVNFTLYQNLTYWTHNLLKTPIKLCGQRLNFTLEQTLQSNQSCQERNLVNCGSEDYPFCAANLTQCPIEDFQWNDKLLTSNGSNITNLSQVINFTYSNNKSTKFPMSDIRIDTNFVCLVSNIYNLYPDESEASQLVVPPQKCDIPDLSYVELNTITTELFFTINNAKNLDAVVDGEKNKTLFRQNYFNYNFSRCGGDPYNWIIQVRQLTDTIITQSNSAQITSIIYLLIVCYIIPGIPFLCRFLPQTYMGCFLCLDYLIRIVLMMTMAGQSIVILGNGQTALNYLQLILDKQCFASDEVQLALISTLQDNITTQVLIWNIIAIAINFAAFGAEMTMWVIIAFQTICEALYRRCVIGKEIQDQDDIAIEMAQQQEAEAMIAQGQIDIPDGDQ
ncbi:hypothetical protein pb186bvf_001016 [Paramecium bursaria]